MAVPLYDPKKRSRRRITAHDRAVDRRNGRKARGSTWRTGRRRYDPGRKSGSIEPMLEGMLPLLMGAIAGGYAEGYESGNATISKYVNFHGVNAVNVVLGFLAKYFGGSAFLGGVGDGLIAQGVSGLGSGGAINSSSGSAAAYDPAPGVWI